MQKFLIRMMRRACAHGRTDSGRQLLPRRRAAQLNRRRFGKRAAGDRNGIGNRLLVGLAGDDIAAARLPTADAVARVGLLALMQGAEEGDVQRQSVSVQRVALYSTTA
jgi:hypothetical protein